MTEREAFDAWANDYGLRAEPNYSKHTEADCWAAWQAARAQTAQAVPASCGECGKKTSDGWALYCVDCMEKAGLPAQAVPLLSEDDMLRAIRPLCHDDSVARLLVENSGDEYRAIEQAVRAKLGVAQWLPISTAPKDCGFLGYQPLTDGMWITAPMYWDGSEFVLLQFHHGNTEPSMSPTHWMQLPEPPNGTN